MLRRGKNIILRSCKTSYVKSMHHPYMVMKGSNEISERTIKLHIRLFDNIDIETGWIIVTLQLAFLGLPSSIYLMFTIF